MLSPADGAVIEMIEGVRDNSPGSMNPFSAPHLHYHLQNSPVMQDGLGIRCVFQKVVVTKDGKNETRTKSSPVKDEIVSPE